MGYYQYGVQFPKCDKKLMRSHYGGVKAVETLSSGHPQLLSVICYLVNSCPHVASKSFYDFSACLTLWTHLGETQLMWKELGHQTLGLTFKLHIFHP